MKVFRLRRAARWRLLRRRVFDWPSIFIVCFGIALWGSWPANIKNISAVEKLQEPTVSFVMQIDDKQLLRSPTVFALPSIYGFGAVDEASGMPDVDDVWYKSSPHYLAREVTDNDAEIVKLISIKTEHGQKLLVNNRVTIENEPIFTVNEKAERGLSIVFHGNLHKYGFETPELDVKLFDADKSWIIRLLVEVDEKGYPNQVFVEKSSSIPRVDAQMIRFINQGRLKQAGIPCEGRITINFGL